MSNYAQIQNGIVTNLIVADQSFIDTFMTGTWIQSDTAGIGYNYNSANNVFYPQQPYPSWTLNTSTSTWTWTPPTPMPTDGGLYNWDESTLSWISA
jgi:hypothetical protein